MLLADAGDDWRVPPQTMLAESGCTSNYSGGASGVKGGGGCPHDEVPGDGPPPLLKHIPSGTQASVPAGEITARGGYRRKRHT
jgi:hypothetical protein